MSFLAAIQKLLSAICILSLSATSVFPATYEFDPNHTLIGVLQKVVVQPEDTILSIAEEFNLGVEEILEANPETDPWVPGEGKPVLLPSQFILPHPSYRGIYVNLAEMRIYYYNPGQVTGEGKKVRTYPISIGRGDWQTPVAKAKIVEKIVNPTWYPPASVRREHELMDDPLPVSVPPGKDNPLGKYALQLNLPGYFIHGTNRPYAIGLKATHGCIRMRPVDIQDFFGRVDRGTPVTIKFQPFKSALVDGVVYLEAHGRGQAGLMDRYLGQVIREISRLTEKQAIPIDWELLVSTAKQGAGIPVPLNRGIGITPRLVQRAPVAAAQPAAAYIF